MKKTKEQVYQEVIDYINAPKHNKPCMLASIKKEFRTKDVIELIFSRPDVFKLEVEYQYIPEEIEKEEFTKILLLSNPKTINSVNDKRDFIIKDKDLTFNTVLAFIFSKYLLEYKSRLYWGIYSEKVITKRDISAYEKNAIKYAEKMVNDLLFRNNDEEAEINFEEYVEYFNSCLKDIDVPTYSDSLYERKYESVNIDIDKPLLILVNGMPDAGKSKVAKMLSFTLNAINIDSDEIDQSIPYPDLPNYVQKGYKKFVLSDTYAFNFFSEDEIEDFEVINVIVKPISIEKLHRNSKYLSRLSIEEHKRNELEKFEHKYDSLEDTIEIINDYEDISPKIDYIIDEIIKKLSLEAVPNSKKLVRKKGLK